MKLSCASLAVAAAILAAPAAAQAKADVTLACGPSETLPQGPPARAGTITVIDANGVVRVVRTVPGPCSAPGHPTNR